MKELRETSGYDGEFLSSGKVIWGHEASVGYFAQDHRALITPGMTAFEWLHQWDPGAADEEIRGLLGQMMFARDEANKRTDVLSGGETARLLFCKLMLQKPNVLVLDEPTNHLDLESINALEHCTAALSGHGAAGHPRSRPDRRSRNQNLALRDGSQDHRLQRLVRGVSVGSGLTFARRTEFALSGLSWRANLCCESIADFAYCCPSPAPALLATFTPLSPLM